MPDFPVEIRSRQEREGELTNYQREQNEFQRRLWRESAKAIGRWLEARENLTEPIHKLTIFDLEGMAVAAICEFVKLREERRVQLKLQSSELTSYERQTIDDYIEGLTPES